MMSEEDACVSGNVLSYIQVVDTVQVLIVLYFIF